MREKVYMWAESDLMAMRMYEYKVHVNVIQTQAQWLDIDMTTKADVGLAPWHFNLYIDPKEEYPVGHRMNAWLASMAGELKGHAARFKKYPPKDIGLDWRSSDGASAVHRSGLCPVEPLTFQSARPQRAVPAVGVRRDDRVLGPVGPL